MAIPCLETLLFTVSTKVTLCPGGPGSEDSGQRSPGIWNILISVNVAPTLVQF